MTSVEQSRHWADLVLWWIDMTSRKLGYYDALWEEVQDMPQIRVILKYRMRKSTIRRLRDKELQKYLDDKNGFIR